MWGWKKKKKNQVEECDELRKTGIIHLKSLTKGANRLEPLQKFGYQENEAEHNSGEEQLKGLRTAKFLVDHESRSPQSIVLHK